MKTKTIKDSLGKEWSYKSIRIWSPKSFRYYKLVLQKAADDYVWHARWYYADRFRTYGNFRGLGWYTTTAHALRGMRREFHRRGDKLLVVCKNPEE